MVIQIDLASIEENIKSEIIKNIEIEFRPSDNNLQDYFKLIYDEDDDKNKTTKNPNSVKGILLEEDVIQINKIKHQIKDSFIKRAIGEYIIIQDEIVSNKLIILKRKSRRISEENIIAVIAEWSLRMKFN